MDYIELDGLRVPYPNSFKMERVPNKVAELTTMSGRNIADINGWKYSDTTLQWDTLLDQDLQNLLDAISSFSFTLKFNDIDGEHIVNAILTSRVNTKSRYKRGGEIVWRDVNITLSFPDCYH